MHLVRFPGGRTSDEIPAWQDGAGAAGPDAALLNSPALRGHGRRGLLRRSRRRVSRRRGGLSRTERRRPQRSDRPRPSLPAPARRFGDCRAAPRPFRAAREIGTNSRGSWKRRPHLLFYGRHGPRGGPAVVRSSATR
jgi:hypothetical protein